MLPGVGFHGLPLRRSGMGGGQGFAFLTQGGGYQGKNRTAPVFGHVLGHLPHWRTGPENQAGVWRHLPAQKRQQRRFAGSVAAHKADALTGFNGKISRVQQRLAAKVQSNALHAQKCQNILQRGGVGTALCRNVREPLPSGPYPRRQRFRPGLHQRRIPVAAQCGNTCGSDTLSGQTCPMACPAGEGQVGSAAPLPESGCRKIGRLELNASVEFSLRNSTHKRYFFFIEGIILPYTR